MSSDYMKLEMKYVTFTDETRATFDGPDGWCRGWVGEGKEQHRRFRRQQGGGGALVWDCINDNELVDPFQVRKGVKITSVSYSALLEEVLLPWL